MLLGIIGGLGAWFEKKAVLFVVKTSGVFFLFGNFVFLVYRSDGADLYWIISWRRFRHCFE